MKFSPLNILDSESIFVGSMSPVVPGKESNNILNDDTLRVYACVGDLDISIFNLGGISIDLIALVNVYFDETLTIQLYDTGNLLLYEETYTVNDWTGFDYKYIYMEVPDTIEYIDRIRIYTEGDDYTEKWIGYAWAGALYDLGCIESCKPVSSSNDAVQISRTNHPHINESYLYRQLDFTISKLIDFKDARDFAEIILTTGYGIGRPWILDDRPFNGEMIFANLDSGNIQNDYIYVKNDESNSSGQFTIGLREVT